MKIPHHVRKDIPLIKDFAYFDNASISLIPEPVIKTVNEYSLHCRGNIRRGIHQISRKATENFEKSREKIADFINASKEEIAFVKNATEALNLIAAGLHWKEKDIVVLTEHEHHSNFVPFLNLGKKGVQCKVVECNSEGNINLAEIDKKLHNSKLFTFSYISGIFGNVLPAKEYSKLAKDTGALVCIDATQAVGHKEINVKDLDCDFLVFSGHTGLLGPTGIGVLYVKENITDELAPIFIGDGVIEDVTTEGYKLIDPPQKYEAGIPNISGVIGLGAAVDYINQIGVQNIEKYERKLTQQTLSSFDDIKNMEWYGFRENHLGIISFNINNLNSHDVAAFLDSYNVIVGSGYHCSIPLMRRLGVRGAVRISYHCFNTKEEIEKMIDILGEISTNIV